MRRWITLKNEYLSLLYQQEGTKILASKEFSTFFEYNQEWLVPYARFCSLRDQYKTPLFSNWGEHKQWKESWRKPLSNPKSKEYKEVAYYYFVQYLLFSQMQEAHAYALHKQVILKGDIPIGVDRHSCDVWVEPKYFNLNSQAGAPPDAFSAMDRIGASLPTIGARCWKTIVHGGRSVSNTCRSFLMPIASTMS